VEHPVTELCTGIDLVQEQFRVAAGLPLSFTQEQIIFRGSAIECRISAENPENRFLPATGTIQALQEPSGPGVRLDSGMYAGLQVPLFYDPLLSKLIVWAGDRQHAIARMRRALSEYHVMGVRTTLPFARWLMNHPRFIAGDMSTDFIAEEWDTRNTETPNEAEPTSVGASAQRSGASINPSRPAPIDRPPAQIAAIVGSLLMDEELEKEKLRRRPAGDGDTERSRWRDLGWKEAVRRV
jgi:acetyl/propionyl-CoA carboxylase alpha subunit